MGSMTQWQAAFAELVAARGQALLRYAFLLCGDPTEAADLVQEGLVRAFRRARLGTDIDSIDAYVRKAMLTVYIDGHRRRRRWSAVRHLLVGVQSRGGVEDAAVVEQPVRAALATLSPRQRACVVLRYYEDLPVDAIAARLGCRPGSVKRHLSDAMARMASRLEPTYGGRGHE